VIFLKSVHILHDYGNESVAPLFLAHPVGRFRLVPFSLCAANTPIGMHVFRTADRELEIIQCTLQFKMSRTLLKIDVR